MPCPARNPNRMEFFGRAIFSGSLLAGRRTLATLPSTCRLRVGAVRCPRYDSPRGWGAFELLPVAPVGVAGLVARHPVGELTVDRVGELGDVAQGAGLAGPLGEGVLLEAVLGRELGEPDGPVEQLL